MHTNIQKYTQIYWDTHTYKYTEIHIHTHNCSPLKKTNFLIFFFLLQIFFLLKEISYPIRHECQSLASMNRSGFISPLFLCLEFIISLIAESNLFCYREQKECVLIFLKWETISFEMNIWNTDFSLNSKLTPWCRKDSRTVPYPSSRSYTDCPLRWFRGCCFLQHKDPNECAFENEHWKKVINISFLEIG